MMPTVSRGVGHVRRNEVHVRLLQAQQEVCVAGQPVQLCDDQLCPVDATRPQRFRQLWAVVLLAALEPR
jgi:hypothetical protein